jgi:large subunit ribosomal protein L35
MKKKQKTRKAAAKRFKITSTGKIKRYKANQRHLLGHESSKTKRNRRGSFTVAKSDENNIKKMLPGV